MAVNSIVAGVTFLVVAFIAVWFFVPRLRPWMELPKQRFLDLQRAFPEVARCPTHSVDDKNASPMA